MHNVHSPANARNQSNTIDSSYTFSHQQRRKPAQLSPTSLMPISSLPSPHRPLPKGMNASPSPVHSLAFEVLSLIFEAVLDAPSPHTSTVDPRTWSEQKGLHVPYQWPNDLAPITLSMVCQKWRHVALHSPRLWRFVRVDTGLVGATGAMAVERLQAYLHRSGAVPLEVFYNSFGGGLGYSSITPGKDIMCLLGQSARRWQSLQARFIGPLHLRQLASLFSQCEQLETLFITQLPLDTHTHLQEEDGADFRVHPLLSCDGLLRTWPFVNLKRLAWNDLEPTSSTSAYEVSHLLASAPRLEQLWFSSIDRPVTATTPGGGVVGAGGGGRHAEWTRPQRSISLPYLTELHLHPSAMMNSLTPDLLDLLTVPSLTSLHLNLLDYIPLQDSIQLLMRFLQAHARAVNTARAAPLTSLAMIAARGDSEVLTIMSMLPDVEHVVIWGSVLEGTAQFCKAFGGPLEFPEYLQMNPYLDDDWEFDEMLRMEEEERKKARLLAHSQQMQQRRSAHHDGSCVECEEELMESPLPSTPLTIDTLSCNAVAYPTTRDEHQAFSDDKIISPVKSEDEDDADDQQLRELISARRRSTIASHRMALASMTNLTHYGNPSNPTPMTFTSWLLPNLRSIHFRTTKFYRGENSLLLLRMLKQRQDIARGLLTSHSSSTPNGEPVMPPVELEAVCLKDMRLCRICRPRFRRMREEAGCVWEKGIARTLCGYMRSRLSELVFDVDVFFEECHTAWDVSNRLEPCRICP